MTDEDLIQKTHEAILEWMMDPSIKQATLIGHLIRLYEQAARGFIKNWDWRPTEDDIADSEDAPDRPRLTVIEGGLDRH